MTAPTAIMLFGPTASGKTALGIQLAQQHNGVIINADSRQVYQEMPILTAMPSAAEFTAAPHKLFEILNPTETFSVADYMARAAAAAAEVVAAGKTPFFVGGTGFYLKALENGISPMPEVPEETVKDLIKRAEKEGSPTLHAELKKVDSASAERLEKTDTQRIIRALSVFETTGKPLSEWQKEPRTKALPFSFYKIALHPPRDVVVGRINQRFEAMLEMGVLDEVRNLRQKYGALKNLPCHTMHGLREIAAYINGEITLEEAKEELLTQTRQYAKRQATWIRNSYHADTTIEAPNISLLKNLPISS